MSESETQHEKINNVENKNAEMKGLLEKHRAEYQKLNDSYYCIMQEHEACKKVKEQLQDLAHRWKAESERNTELDSVCTKLRQELKRALGNQTPDKPLLRVEEV